MPSEGTEVLENMAFDLAREASELAGQLHPTVRMSVADLVRSACVICSNRRSLNVALNCTCAMKKMRNDCRNAAFAVEGSIAVGDLERGKVPRLMAVSERTVRPVISALVEKQLLVSESHKAPLCLGFPADVIERWFSRLYP